MKRIGLIFLTLFITIASVNLANGQESVSAEKMALIKELVEATGGRQNFTDIMNSVLTAQREQTKKMMDSLFVNDKNMSADDKAMVKKVAEESVERIVTRGHEYFTKKFDFDKFVDDVYMPLYAKHFTDDELRDIIAFYRSPTGQKTMKKMPEVMADCMAALSEHFLPDFMQFMKQSVDEEMAAIKQKLPKKKISRRS